MTTTHERRFDPIDNPWAGGARAAWPDRRALIVGAVLLGVIPGAAAIELAFAPAASPRRAAWGRSWRPRP